MAKYTDMREIQVTVLPTWETGYTVFSHGLTDGDGDSVDPDEVNAEFVNAEGTTLFPATIIIARPSSPGGIAIGLTAGQIGVFVNKDTNATGVNQVYTIRVTSKYIHSIQSDDHTA